MRRCWMEQRRREEGEPTARLSGWKRFPELDQITLLSLYRILPSEVHGQPGWRSRSDAGQVETSWWQTNDELRYRDAESVNKPLDNNNRSKSSDIPKACIELTQLVLPPPTILPTNSVSTPANFQVASSGNALIEPSRNYAFMASDMRRFGGVHKPSFLTLVAKGRGR